MQDLEKDKMNQKKKLKFLEDFKEKIITGEKTSTIRKGFVEKYEKGDIVDVMVGNETIGEAEITEIKHLSFKEITTEDAIQDGFKSKKELKKVLKKIYPDFKSTDEVTKIEFILKRLKNYEH